jgi:hypothetical protein
LGPGKSLFATFEALLSEEEKLPKAVKVDIFEENSIRFPQ